MEYFEYLKMVVSDLHWGFGVYGIRHKEMTDIRQKEMTQEKKEFTLNNMIKDL